MFNKTPPNKTELAEVTPTADAYLTKSGTSKYFVIELIYILFR
jgi:hypothetical protein